MGYFKDLEIDEVDPGYVDPNQLKLFVVAEAPAVHQAASAPGESGISRPVKLSVKDIRYIEEFLAKRLKAG